MPGTDTPTPDKIVAVPGIGNISFPGDMDDASVGNAIQTHMLKTGQGMQEQAQTQARNNSLSSLSDRMSNDPDVNKARMVDALGHAGPPVTGDALPGAPQPKTRGEASADLSALGTGAAIAEGAMHPVATGASLAGGYYGARKGGEAGKWVGGKFNAPDTGETAGEITGGLVGGAMGGETGPLALRMLRSFRQAPEAIEGAAADPVASAVKQRIANWIPPKIKPKIGQVGSAAQEAGYQPAITKVPTRPQPSSPLTPEQIPGPDTAGKGNLLTPAAKRGDPRAAQELQRRGRNVLYVPAEDYPQQEKFETLQERMRKKEVQ